MTTSLYINYWKCPTTVRQAEIDECLEKNIANRYIDRVVALSDAPAESPEKWAIAKIDWLEFPNGTRPTFRQFFDVVNRLTQPGDLNIVANADVFFDDTLAKLVNIDLHGVCLALTRWEHRSDGSLKLEKRENSQDTWIFRGRMGAIGPTDFLMGCFGCDNRLAWVLSEAGYKVVNPCFDIVTHHRHDSGLRGDRQRITGKHKRVKRCKLADAGLSVNASVSAAALPELEERIRHSHLSSET